MSSRPWALWLSVVLVLFHPGESIVCPHEAINLHPPDIDDEAANGNHTRLFEGRPAQAEMSLNTSKLFHYQNYNTSTMNLPEQYRRLIIYLEPCEGAVYLLVRKTRRCWPDPHSCCRPKAGGKPTAPPCSSELHRTDCGYTNFHSVIDGSRDGTASYFEIPHQSAQYFITVFAPKEINLNYGVKRPKFRLTVLADVGAYPRPGQAGRVQAKLVDEGALEVSWDVSTFIPLGVSDVRNYHLYSSLLLAQDKQLNQAVMINPSKVMNSACGLERNAVKYGSPISPETCINGVCKTVISGILPRRRYMLNILVESHRAFNASYSGIVVSTDWVGARHAFSDWSDTTTSLVGALLGTVFGVLGIGYMWIVKLYK